MPAFSHVPIREYTIVARYAEASLPRNRLKYGVDGGEVIELNFFYELDAVI